MFVQLKLKNFRKHEDRTFNFENGVVALRGANEKGKTTMLEGISYAMGGARLLREPLAEVVTWGQKETSLKVWLTFQINSVIHTVIRSKSGAEIKVGDEIKATGQDEVTHYIETLLGCSIKTATNLMLANQQKLRGTLEEDGAAVKLIEQLADFQLIDRIVALVQKHLPCGTTASVEARMQMLDQQVAQPIEDDRGPALQELSEARQGKDTAGIWYATKKEAYDKLQQPAKDAQGRLDRVVAAQRRETEAQQGLMRAKLTLETINPVPGPSDERIAELRKQYEDEGRFARAVAAKRALQTAPEPVWEGPYSDLIKERDQFMTAANKRNTQATDLKIQIANAKSQRITATACGLCGKDLSAVPEVVQKNDALDIEIKDLEAALKVLLLEEAEARENFTTYNTVAAQGAIADQIFQKHAEFITLDRNFTPAKWTWIGPDTGQQCISVANDLSAAVSQQQAYQRELGRQQQAQTAVNVLKDAVTAAKAELTDAETAVGNAQAVLDEAALATNELFEAEGLFRQADQRVKDAERELQMREALYQQKLTARKNLEDQLALAKKELADMAFNNELVNTLRKARPSIVEELWNIVGATVSQTFSLIRGVPSTFLRADDSFTVDGRGIKGLSGSTLDALGLAIRMALTKTFLPNTRFMVLDEPAAAADEDRETNMLGVIASSEFDQILLVTHSELCDSFAAQVIQL